MGYNIQLSWVSSANLPYGSQLFQFYMSSVWREDWEFPIFSKGQEVWKIHLITGYPVSNYGQVDTPQGLTYGEPYGRDEGHLAVWFNNRLFYVHRMVLDCFNPNPCSDVYKVCDHINEDKWDNWIGNLRWYTATLNNLNRQGDRGFSRNKKTKKGKPFQAEVCIRKIGLRWSKRFKTSYEARRAYLAKKKEVIAAEEDRVYQLACRVRGLHSSQDKSSF